MPMDEISTDLEGRVAVVMGAAEGGGRAHAVMLARNGCRGVVVHFHPEELRGEAEETAAEIAFMGAEAILVCADLTRVADVVRLFDAVEGRFGRLDVVVNTIGKLVRKPLRDVTEADFDETFAVNSKAVFFCMQEAAKRIRDHGRIVNIGMTLERTETGLDAIYAGSKAPLDHFVRAMAREVGVRGVTINTVASAPARGANEDDRGGDAGPIPARPAWGADDEFDEMTPVVEFLVGPGGGRITAQTLSPTGGHAYR